MALEEHQGTHGWHAHSLLRLRSRAMFAPCESDWKRCRGPFVRWSPFSARFVPQEDVPTPAVTSWTTQHPDCSGYCARKIVIEERLGHLFGWARIDPIRLSDHAALTYALKYVLKDLCPSMASLSPADRARAHLRYLDFDQRWGVF